MLIGNRINVRLQHNITFIMWVIALCNVQSRLEIVHRLCIHYVVYTRLCTLPCIWYVPHQHVGYMSQVFPLVAFKGDLLPNIFLLAIWGIVGYITPCTSHVHMCEVSLPTHKLMWSLSSWGQRCIYMYVRRYMCMSVCVYMCLCVCVCAWHCAYKGPGPPSIYWAQLLSTPPLHCVWQLSYNRNSNNIVLCVCLGVGGVGACVCACAIVISALLSSTQYQPICLKCSPIARCSKCSW